MRTGWPQQPAKLVDRIDEDNNILIETRSSNYFKHNFSQTFYPTLKAQLLSAKIPHQWADCSISPRPFDAELESFSTETDAADDEWADGDGDGDWGMEEMDGDVLGNVEQIDEDIAAEESEG
ncbi:hypothetical protein NM208_g14103 [Fusarium decemcellulare]|uniref:Uncharacterized protein n=1 Tax=Fusarium decemcellulare TaxID=57161 RepID=A0ACC1RJ75_9HYPO|nr:hypothetical protein NM208_g14103 [Fusarium decemcellulare]